MNPSYLWVLLALLLCVICKEERNKGHISELQYLEYLEDISPFLLAVHGGAGSYERNSTTFEKEELVKQGLLEALRAGYKVLKSNRSSLEAVREAIIKFEDNPLFNAGRGGAINEKFEIELDASLMDGSQMKVGAVAAVKHVKNPILAAEKVLKETRHVLLAGDGADDWAKNINLTIVPNYYFFTQEKIDEWFKAKDRKENLQLENKHKMGTVGAVALDKLGHLSAGTSTGGITYKMAGRVGDSPITGAGNYANDATCAVSCTGQGEVMMKKVLAFDIHARMLYKSISLQKASEEVFSSINSGTGGYIAIDRQGNVQMPFNTGGMARGYVRQDGKAFIYVFREGEDLTPIEYDISG
jgi:beta-aspartyl-peptidase (threonine type)